jgi:integrase/recombinase XerD
VQPLHVAAFVKQLERELSPPTVKQHLAALRMLLDWLVTGHVMETNPAHSVRGPKHAVKKGKTPVLAAEEARTLLDSIPADTLTGLRDCALIGVMVYTFARVHAVVEMKVRDYFTQGRRGWIRLHEKGGKEHEVPCHHSLERILNDYIEAAGVAGDPNVPLFRSTGRKTGEARPLWQQDVYRMIQRRAAAAGIKTRIGNHTVPRDRHHRLSEEQGHAGARADDRQSRLTENDEALRSAKRRDRARRGGEDCDLMY